MQLPIVVRLWHACGVPKLFAVPVPVPSRGWRVIRGLLFLLPRELAHSLSLAYLRLLGIFR